MRPIVETVRKGDMVLRWPSSWGRNYPDHLARAGKVDRAWADRVIAAFDAAEADPNAVMVTPMVVEIIAERVD
jgi:hypothetical protein